MGAWEEYLSVPRGEKRDARPHPRRATQRAGLPFGPLLHLTDLGVGMFYRHFSNANLSPDLTWNHVLKLKEGSHFS